MKKSFRKYAMGAAIIGLGGYLTGILTAPKSGKQTRQDIKDNTQKTLQDVETELKKIADEINSLLEEAKNRGQDIDTKARTHMEEAVNSAKAAQAKATELIRAFHEGKVQDDDLQTAINQANRALIHLRNYLKK